jgi:N-formylglutamate amidohydrolase
MDFYRSDAKRVQSIMIEINRGVYMDEETGEKLPTFDQVKDKVGKAIVELLSFTRQRINT